MRSDTAGVRTLLRSGADVNASQANGMTRAVTRASYLGPVATKAWAPLPPAGRLQLRILAIAEFEPRTLRRTRQRDPAVQTCPATGLPCSCTTMR